jgi:aryl-alcohol dehydrogenase-like predicted oxidoreductase
MQLHYVASKLSFLWNVEMINLQTQNGATPSSLCFGCMQFGGTSDAANSQAMFELCRDHGINFFDTAHTYNEGVSDQFLGRFIKQDRDELIIATKAGYTGGSGRDNLLQQFDESRSRLDLDTIDILYLHRWDSETPLDETFEALYHLQDTGKLRYIGVSNFAAWQVMKAQAVARSMGTGIDILQPMYSLVKRQVEVELLPMALAEGIEVAPYSPLGGGLLTGKYLSGGTGRLSSDKRYAARYGQDWMTETAQGLSVLADEMGIEAATLAVAWAGHHPAVTAPIISARNVAQLAPSLKAQSLRLTDDAYQRIEALSVRPAPATDRLEEAVL